MTERNSPSPRGPYTVWQDYGSDGWTFTDFATLREAVDAPKYAHQWHISRPAKYEIVEPDGE